jgi:hypothetical protein
MLFTCPALSSFLFIYFILIFFMILSIYLYIINKLMCLGLAERQGEQRCLQSPVGTERRLRRAETRETKRESVERVQFPIGPRGRKKKGRRCGKARLKEKPRRAVVRHDEAEGKKNQKEQGFHFSRFPVLSFVFSLF